MSKELLPELPEPVDEHWRHFNESQMRAYGQACYEAGRKSVDHPSDEVLALGRQAVMALDCSGPSWNVGQHYEAAGYSTHGIPGYLLAMACPMPKENRAELLWYAMHPNRLLAIIDGEKPTNGC